MNRYIVGGCEKRNKGNRLTLASYKCVLDFSTLYNEDKPSDLNWLLESSIQGKLKIV